MTTSCGTDTSVREPIAAKKNQKKVQCGARKIIRPLALFMAALREIFEESAYERFLDRHSLISSPRAYRDFLRETEGTKARRPKCC